MAIFTVILPVYNESKRLDHVFNAVLEFSECHPDYQFVFVDDGSTDSTANMLGNLINDHQSGQIQLVCLSVNCGKGSAIKSALAHCTSEYVCFTDGDLAYSLDHLLPLAEALKAHDVVIGSRNLAKTSQRNISMIRRILGWGFNRLVRVILQIPYDDTQAGLKGFRFNAAQRLFDRLYLMNFSFDAELIFLARKYQMRIDQIPVHVSRFHSYKHSSLKLYWEPIWMFFDLIHIRFNSLRGRYD